MARKKKTTRRSTTRTKSATKKRSAGAATRTGKSRTTRNKKSARRGMSGSPEFTVRLRERFEESVEDVRVQLDELEATFERTFSDIIERGRKTQKDLGKRVRAARKEVGNAKVVQRVKERVKELDGAAKRVRESADSTWKTGVDTLHDALDLPSRQELSKLSKKVDQLTRKVRTLENR